MSAAGAVLLALSVVAIGAAALRIATTVAADGPERVLAAVPIAGGLAAFESMAAGVFGLGTRQFVLAGSAALTFLLARLLLPEPEVSLGQELRSGWRQLPASAQLGTGIAIAVLAAFAAVSCRHPFFSDDGSQYHLPLIDAWVHSGRVGAEEQPYKMLPVGNYPLTNEVVLTWISALSRSFAFLPLWSATMLATLAVAVASLARRLASSRTTVWSATGAVVFLPLAVAQVNTVKNDLPALTWLAVTAALAIAAVPRRPGLMGPAVLAALLAGGTKTTALPLAGAVVIVSFVALRDRRREAVAPVVLGLLIGLPIGATWYVRNLLEHGSPVWPLAQLPWGDRVPPFLPQFSRRFVDEPVTALRGQWRAHLEVVAGGIILVIGGLAAPLLARTRAVLAGWAATVVATALWATGPVTGATNAWFALLAYGSTTRYLLPAMLSGAITLALVGATSSGRRRITTLLLGAAVVWSAVMVFAGDPPLFPSNTVLVVGVMGGAAAAVVARQRWSRDRLVRVPALIVVPLTAIVVALAGARFTDGWLDRHLAVFQNGRPAISWMLEQPLYRSGDHPVLFVNLAYGELAGPHLEHDMALVPDGTPCPELDRAAAGAWLVILHRNIVNGDPYAEPDDPVARGCLVGRTPAHVVGDYTIYAPAAGARQTATTSSATSRSSVPSRKSDDTIAAAFGEESRRLRLSIQS